MAETLRRDAGDRKPRSRLQRKAPESLQVVPVSDLNIAIPLLSPLVPSPPPERGDGAAAGEEEPRLEHRHRDQIPEAVEQGKKKAVVVVKNWQHPAAPFCYEPVPLMHSFVPV